MIRIGHKTEPGIAFVSSTILKVGIASLGITVSAVVWWHLGALGVGLVLSNILITALLSFLICRLALGLGKKASLLIGVGTCICGASAIAATAPAIRSTNEETGLALGVVTLFGLSAMFLYPVFFSTGVVGAWMVERADVFGLWCGIGIHETAQVVAAASQVDGALEIAVAAKSIRVLMIGPAVLVASCSESGGQPS